MSKKYLLYIHHPGFATEQKKSALVNQLLAGHYDDRDSPAPVLSASRPLPAGKERTHDVRPAKSMEEELDDPVCLHGREEGYCPNVNCPYNPNN